MTATFPLLVAGSLCAAVGQLALKIGADGRDHWLAFVNPWILAGLLSYAAGTAIWIYCLSKADLTVVYAFAALSFVLVYAGGLVILGEKMAPRGFLGVILVLCGLMLIVTQQKA